ncbi:glycoside hydrolase [Crassisporium funariophilum]|nr:glycoside hydrolase [Crassisporium funariophilum]
MGYYPDWVGSTFPPERIDFKRYDWVDFAFAVPNAEFALVWDDMENGPSLLKRLVAAAHAAGSKVKLSIGGWTGSRHFSTAVASAENREAFARNIHAAYNMYDLDGIDIDWEYPGREGAGGNRVDSNDTANLLLFLQTLRAILPSTARISAAAQTTTFVDSQGQPMADVSEFAKVLDWVLLMNYDVWGSSSDPGPNAPLHDACGNSTQADASALAAYNAWTSAKFPACQMALGVPSYGYISTSKAERLRTRSRAHSLTEQRRQGNYVKLVDEDGGSDSQVQFREMVKQGALVRSLSEDGSGTTFEPSGGFEKFWDTCSGTPFLRSKSSGQVITYDDPKSLGMKAAFAKQVGMMGINMFDVHGDIDEWDLTDGIRQAVDLV